tara:strand:+ start:669 stop:1199 length:531 start_codon:yes stop_codon:yes gene_type:complete
MRLTSQKLVGWVTVACTVVSFSRVAVLFLESLSVVREERTADYELLELCRSGSAKQSPKMRTACLQANAERASPVVLKAIVRAVSTTFHEFAASVNSPFGFATVALFVLSSLVLPIAPMIKAVSGAWRGSRVQDLHRDVDYDSDDLEDHTRHIVMIPGVKRRQGYAIKGDGTELGA